MRSPKLWLRFIWQLVGAACKQNALSEQACTYHIFLKEEEEAKHLTVINYCTHH
jgi:hypothetical protein